MKDPDGNDNSAYLTEAADGSNGSGKGYAEPQSGISTDGQYPDADSGKAKGNIYSNPEIRYSRVAVVKQSDGSGNRPEGCIVYDFTDMGGAYQAGLTDMWQVNTTWKNGFIKGKTVYSSSDKMVSSEKYEYDYIPMGRNSNMPEFTYLISERSSGWTRLKKSTSTVEGVPAVKEYEYYTEPADIVTQIKHTVNIDNDVPTHVVQNVDQGLESANLTAYLLPVMNYTGVSDRGYVLALLLRTMWINIYEVRAECQAGYPGVSHNDMYMKQYSIYIRDDGSVNICPFGDTWVLISDNQDCYNDVPVVPG
jgi:hypothetical protein